MNHKGFKTYLKTRLKHDLLFLKEQVFFGQEKGISCAGKFLTPVFIFCFIFAFFSVPKIGEAEIVSCQRVKVVDRTLMTDFDCDGSYKSFTIKGAGYSPYPIGRNPSDWGWPEGDTRIDNIFNDPAILDRDFQMLKDMNANTIRIWKGDDTEEAGRFPVKLTQTTFDKALEYDIRIIAGFWLPIEGKWGCNNSTKEYQRYTDYADPAVRRDILDRWAVYVNTFKDHPALLFWAIGNENNLHFSDNVTQTEAFYSLINEMARQAHEIEGESFHPVAIVNGDVLNVAGADPQLNHIDIWGVNAYRGETFGSLFKHYKQSSSKPLWISEFGVDAWHVYDVNNPEDGYEDQEAQAFGVEKLVHEIQSNDDVCIGGTVMEYADEWWKPAEWQGDMSHDKDGFGPRDDSCPSDGVLDWYPSSQDNFYNSEWWGIMAISKDPMDSSRPDVMTPRDVYYVLQERFEDPIEISSCQDMNESGKSYVLTRDLTGSEVVDKCLAIKAGGITLDCNGHKIENTALNGTAIYINGWRAKVKNCDLVGPVGGSYSSSTGIASYWSDYSVIENNNVSGFGTGIKIYANQNVVDNNVVTNSVKAIHVSKNRNIVKNNLAKNNIGWGLASWKGPDAHFINNKVYGNRYGNVLSYAENSILQCDQYSSNGTRDIHAYNGSSNVALKGVQYESKYSAYGSSFLESADACDDLDCEWNGDVCEELFTFCGDNVYQSLNDQGEAEICDGTDLSGATCVSLGWDGGTLKCDTSCSSYDESGCTSICGNGNKTEAEPCDDGNNDPGDGCDADCQIEYCGDGIVNNNGNEECDKEDGVGEYQECGSDCKLIDQTYCGDGIVQPSVHDLVAEPYLSVIDPVSGQPKTVSLQYVDPSTVVIWVDSDSAEVIEGDSVVIGGILFHVDIIDLDESSSTFSLPSGRVIVRIGEANDQGVAEICDSNSQACTVNGYNGTQLCDNTSCLGWQACVPDEYCGDGTVNGNEFCDEGQDLNGQAGHCNAACTGIGDAMCGNNIIDPGETCDDGNINSGDGCSANCQIEYCGDGIINNNGTEECDGTAGVGEGQACESCQLIQVDPTDIGIKRFGKMISDTEVEIAIHISESGDYYKALGIVETIPSGWQVDSVSHGGIVRNGRIEWLAHKFTSLPVEKVNITYKMTYTGEGTADVRGSGYLMSIIPELLKTIHWENLF